MRDFLRPLRNLRLPGRRPQPVRRSAYTTRQAGGRQTGGRLNVERLGPFSSLARRLSSRGEEVRWRRAGILGGSAVSAVALIYLAAWMVTGDTFRVTEIDVTGAEIEHPHAIAFASGTGGNSMLTLDLAEAQRRVASLPGIRATTVTRDWPRGVQIEVEEHQAWGYWQAGNEVLVLNEDGDVLDQARPAPEDAPMIVELAGTPADEAAREERGETNGVQVDRDSVRLVARLLQDRAFQRTGVEPQAFLFRGDRGLTVLTDGAPDTVFGDSSNYEFKVEAWQGLVRQIQEDDIEAQEIDLRFGRNVVLR